MFIRTKLFSSSFRFATLLSIASLWLANPLPGQRFGVTPSNVNAVPSQRIQFSIKNTGVIQSVVWSLTPTVGSISPSGLYTAPSSISSMQKVWAIASSPSMSARAIIYLQPGTNVSISPGAVSLSLGESKQFTATVTGTTNLGVSWSLNPAVGTISSTGLYKAPQTLASSQTIALTARSVADPSKSASVLLTVAVPVAVTLPVEIMGSNGTTIPVPVTVPGSADVSGNLKLWMQIHALDYEDKISVQVNNAPWISLNTTTTNLLGLANAYGGIGGGFHTLKLTVNLPSGYIQTGLNIVRFRFNMTDGRSSGFRVLAFNFQKSDGTLLLPPDMFVDDNPSLWEPPLRSPSDISTGRTLWFQAPLTVPTVNGPAPIRARCSNCHAQDGRDLKYFNYSNISIRARSVFHGLTAQQGDQIASYIRSLNISAPGRPWNPPYQPGPGLDSKPVEEWAAGAGLDAVAESDQQSLDGIFPGGIQDAVFSPAGNLSVRETRVAFELPDWNRWLPPVHPLDAWGDEFTNSQFFQGYTYLRSQLRYQDAAVYANSKAQFGIWQSNFIAFVGGKILPPDSPGWTRDHVNKVYATPLWVMVKLWEMMNEFGLEDLARSVLVHPQADSRAWYSGIPFITSPNLLKIPQASASLQNGKMSTHAYLAYVWYHVQLILNNSNKENFGSPIDWPYTLSSVNNMAAQTGLPQVSLRYIWRIKALQLSNNGKGPEYGVTGWHWPVTDPAYEVFQDPDSRSVWKGTSPSTRLLLYEASLKAYLNAVTAFTPQQFYAGATTPATTPLPGQPFGNFADRIWYSIPLYRHFGVSQTVIDQIANWAKTLWPNANWDRTKTAPCTQLSTGAVTCSTEVP